MCKQHTLYFGCGHRVHNRQSTCRSQVTCPSSRPGGARHKACLGHSYIAVSIAGRCGECNWRAAERHIEFSTETLRMSAIALFNKEIKEDDLLTLDDVEAWRENKLAQASAERPLRRLSRFRPAVGWQSRKKTGRTSSLLKYEVKPEEVVGFESWESNYANDDGGGETNYGPTGWGEPWDAENDEDSEDKENHDDNESQASGSDPTDENDYLEMDHSEGSSSAESLSDESASDDQAGSFEPSCFNSFYDEGNVIW